MLKLVFKIIKINFILDESNNSRLKNDTNVK